MVELRFVFKKGNGSLLIDMKRCKRCLMPDTRPGIKFNEEGICYPCLNAERRKQTNWKYRSLKLKEIADKHRSKDGTYDCIIPASGGKDSYFQTYFMKNYLDMNPLIVRISDSYTHTKIGEENLFNMCDTFGVDLLTYNLNHKLCRKMTRIAFEEFGSPNYPIDLAIYSIPLKIAIEKDIPLVVYGENISYEYGGPSAEETYSAKDQIKNNVVRQMDDSWWIKMGIPPDDLSNISYPKPEEVDILEPIYLSYFFPWDGKKNAEFSKRFGFKTLESEWIREGFIEQYDQLDSIGYLLHPLLKYPKFGHARATDVACNWIRNGDITREEGIKLVKEHDHKIDQRIIDDFIEFTRYTYDEFYNIMDTIYNRDLFKKEDGVWKRRFEIE